MKEKSSSISLTVDRSCSKYIYNALSPAREAVSQSLLTFIRISMSTGQAITRFPIICAQRKQRFGLFTGFIKVKKIVSYLIRSNTKTKELYTYFNYYLFYTHAYIYVYLFIWNCHFRNDHSDYSIYEIIT